MATFPEYKKDQRKQGGSLGITPVNASGAKLLDTGLYMVVELSDHSF